MSVVAKGTEADYSIKPESKDSVVDTSEWPLLLKNYSKRMAYYPSMWYLADRLEC